MARLTHFVLRVYYDDELARQVNQTSFFAVGQAVERRLAVDPVDAPFGKLVVVVGRLGVAPDVDFGPPVISTFVGVDPADFIDKPVAETRRRAGELLLQGLDQIRAKVPWDDAEVRELVEEASRHNGMYRAPDRLRLSARRRGHTYQVFFEWDEHSTHIILEEYDLEGNLQRRLPVAWVDRVENIYGMWHVTKARLVDDRVEFIHREGRVLFSISLGGPDPVAARENARELVPG
jgi:hypothetical protein